MVNYDLTGMADCHMNMTRMLTGQAGRGEKARKAVPFYRRYGHIVTDHYRVPDTHTRDFLFGWGRWRDFFSRIVEKVKVGRGGAMTF